MFRIYTANDILLKFTINESVIFDIKYKSPENKLVQLLEYPRE